MYMYHLKDYLNSLHLIKRVDLHMEKEELGVVHAPFYLFVFSFVEYLIQMEYSQEVGVVE